MKERPGSAPLPDHLRELGSSDLSTTVAVRRAVEGDPGSIEWLFLHFGPLLAEQAAYRLGHPGNFQDAEDVVAEAWLVTFPRLSDLIPRDGRLTPVLLRFLATAIRRIANRRLSDRLRTTKEIPQSEDTPNEFATPPGLAEILAGPREEASRQDTHRRIHDTLNHLDPADRAVVLLRAVEGLSNQEIAIETGELANTISKRYHRALTRLRELLPKSIFDELLDP